MTWTPQGYRTTASRRMAAVLLAFVLVVITAFRPAPAAAQAASKPAPQPAAQPKELTVAAAADMEPVFAIFGPVFEKKTGLKLRVSYASSAVLSQQIQHGSPADIFFSADFYFAEQVVADNLTESKTPTPYARGVLVLWTRNDSRFHKPLSIDVLSQKDLKSIAIANPDKAPYGRAAVAALKHMHLWDSLSPHIVQAESIAQAAQFALSGNAELALISQTSAVSPKYKAEGTYVMIPTGQYPEIRQCAVILKNGANREGAHQLLRFMLSDEVQGKLKDLGLNPVR